MPDSLTAESTPLTAPDTDLLSADPTENWVFDTDRLSIWQNGLLDCCDAIRDQLSEIRTRLDSSPATEDFTSPTCLRIAR